MANDTDYLFGGGTTEGGLLIPPVEGFGAQPTPPKDEEDRKGRTNAWKGFLDSVQTDPTMQLMLLNLGAQLMQPVQPGQTSLGHAGQALAGSANMLYKLRTDRAAAGVKGAKTAEEIASSKSKRGVEEAKLPHEIDLMQARAGAARRQGKTAKGQEVDRLSSLLRRAAPEAYPTEAEAVIAATQFIDRAKISPEKEKLSALARILPNWSVMSAEDKTEILAEVEALTGTLSESLTVSKKGDEKADPEAQQLFDVYLKAQRKRPKKGSPIYKEIIKRVKEKYPDFKPKG